MELPKIIDIATKNVVSISDTHSIQDAVNLMLESNHRDVIITSQNSKKYGLIKTSDLIKFKLQNIDFSRAINTVKIDYVNTVHESLDVTEALEEITSSCNCLCVVNDANELLGFVSYYDIISSIDPNMLLAKRAVSELLLTSHLKEADQSEPTHRVIAQMNTHIHDSVIIKDGIETVGIITTKDIIALFGKNRDLSKPIKEYMSSPIQTVSHDTSIAEAITFIQEKHFKRLIIVDEEGELIGQISQEELIAKAYSKWAELMRDQDDQLQHLNKVLHAKASKFEELSSTDPLTGIPNRTKIEFELTNEISKIKRYQTEPFTLVFFDIDHFKKINDTHGHLVGDNVLKNLTKTVQNTLRTTDVFARWGGEEFVIILPHTPLEKGVQAVELLKEKISQMECLVVKNVTCSFGVTGYIDGDDNNSILLRADNAMYNAKESGRDKIITA